MGVAVLIRFRRVEDEKSAFTFGEYAFFRFLCLTELETGKGSGILRIIQHNDLLCAEASDCKQGDLVHHDLGVSEPKQKKASSLW